MHMRLRYTTGGAVALAIAAASFSTFSQQAAPGAASVKAAPLDAEEQVGALMRGKPYEGPAVPAPRGLDGRPEFTGYWRPVREPGKPGGNLGKDFDGFQLPFTATGRRAVLYSQNHTVDPEALCILGGIPRHNGSGLPFEVLHTPGRIAFTYHYNTSRRIPIGDGLKADANAPRRYFGTEVARWEGDTLVIHTTGLRDSSHDKVWLDENGNPTSDATQVEERWTRPDFHHFHLEMTVTDPKYYAQPIHFSRTWEAAPEGLGIQEYACNEANLATENIGPGAGVVGPDGNRGYGKPKPLPDAPPGPDAYGL
jgi:hypothetical protein